MALMKEVNETVYKIIGSCMDVHRTLGPGFSIELYKKALQVEMAEKELAIEQDRTVEIKYKDVLVGTQIIDFIVNEAVIIALRSQDNLKDMEIQQVLRLLPLTSTGVGLLVNFGNIKIQYKRILPSRQSREPRSEQPMRPMGYREIGT